MRPADTLPALRDELRQMKTAGLPIAPEELQASLPPPEQNAALVYRELGALLKAKPPAANDKIATDGVGRGPLTADRATRLRKAFQNRADIGRLIHKAVARPQCVFDRKWSQGAAMTFPEFAVLRKAARWLSAESALQLYDGKPFDAVRTDALGFRLASHAAHDPMLIAYLVAVGVDNITLNGMERILYLAGDSPGVAQEVRREVDAAWQPHSLAYGLRGEVILPLVEMEKSRKSSPEAYEQSLRQERHELPSETVPPLSAEDKQNWNRFVDRSEVAVLDNLRLLIDLADRPYSEVQPAFHKVISDVDAHRQDAAFTNARIVFPDYEQSIQVRAAARARVKIIQAAAAVFAWKTRHGLFPDNLQAAMSKVPDDPFDGKSLRYRRETRAGFVIYSVGPTGRFNGGTAAAKPKLLEAEFRFPMPAPRK